VVRFGGLWKMDGNDDVVVFRKKAKRTNVRRKKQDGEQEDDDEGEAFDVSEKIMGAKFDQKLRKRVKGLTVTDMGTGTSTVQEKEEVIGTEFTEQSNTTELDRAREMFVEEQIGRIRRGEAPEMPVISTPAPTTDDPKFVSGGFQLPSEQQVIASRWAGSTKQVFYSSLVCFCFIYNIWKVPEIELPRAEAEKQYEYTKKVCLFICLFFFFFCFVCFVLKPHFCAGNGRATEKGRRRRWKRRQRAKSSLQL
jgi:hypothetical protein